MKGLLIAFAATAAGTALYAADRDANHEEIIEVNEVPRYTELLDWLNSVKRPGFELRRAGQEAGLFFALFKTKDGDAAFCWYQLEPSVGNQVSTYGVHDLEGNDLLEPKSDRLQALVRKFRIKESANRVSHCNLADGRVYPLVQPPPKRVRVLFEFSAGERPKRTVFDEVIDFD